MAFQRAGKVTRQARLSTVMESQIAELRAIRTHAGWGLTMSASEAAQLALQIAEAQERAAQRASRKRVVCGAKTRRGTSCKHKSEPGKRRCKFHGGRSTGPKSEEGNTRIADAQRLRWALWRVNKGVTGDVKAS